MTEKENTFAEIFAEMSEKSAPSSEKVPEATGPVKSIGEINIDDFSDTAVGDKVKYTRPDLNGKDDVVDKYQVFPKTDKDEIKTSQSGTSKYWSVTQILHYASKNEDDVQNKEYISGARCFENRDGTASDINFWYEGATNQSAMLWEDVAKALGIEPKELSPRQFVAFLNSKPKVKIIGLKFKNYKAAANAPKHITKNWPQFTKV